MADNKEKNTIAWIYMVSFVFIMILGTMAIVSFIKALNQTPIKEVQIVRDVNSDSILIEKLSEKVDILKEGVDSLKILLNKRYSRKKRAVVFPSDNIVVDVHIHKDSIQ